MITKGQEKSRRHCIVNHWRVNGDIYRTIFFTPPFFSAELLVVLPQSNIDLPNDGHLASLSRPLALAALQ